MSERLLLLSNSRAPDGSYLRWPREHITSFLGKTLSRVTFIPFAAVPGTPANYDAYTDKVRAVFAEMEYALDSVHENADPAGALRNAQAIVVGGGNTFHLLAQLHTFGLVDVIAARVREGVPYVGWSAGAVVACPTLSTTNDMPIVEPRSFRALGLAPFQINAHYTNALPAGHQGETRAERIAEFLALHPHLPVIGLREGALLRVEGKMTSVAGTGATVFRAGRPEYEVSVGRVLP
jgi:dipeptidase E